MLTALDLFSGIGGMALAVHRAGFNVVALCEIEPYCRRILRQHFPSTPIAEDIHDVTRIKGAPGTFVELGLIAGDSGLRLRVGTHLGSAADPAPTLVTGAFPVRANYSRGTRRDNDDRSLWDEFVRVVRETEPAWVVVETIPRLIHLGLDDAAWDLERVGYATQALTIPAPAVDCPLRQERLYLVGAQRADPGPRPLDPRRGGNESLVAGWAAPRPGLCRVAQRSARRLDEHVVALVTLGDATVPQQARPILETIAAVELEWRTYAEVPQVARGG